MGGLSIGLSALCLGLLWGLLRQRQKTKKLYRQMEAFLDGQKPSLEISLGESPSARLQNAAARLENALLSRTQLRTCRAVSAKLEEDSMALLKSGITDWDEGFALLRERFGVDSDRYEELFDEALEHAFDFMEAAFANSQELVLFVTELNTGAYSVHFLQDYECERYYQYNRNLLFSQEEQEIEALLNKRG